MSASLIARPTAEGFAGRFCAHGSPDGVVPLLLQAMISRFNGSASAALTYLIDDHPAGWYRLDGVFSHDSGYFTDRRGGTANLCYCHGQAPAPAWTLDDKDAADAGVEWAYVLEDKGLRVLTPIRNGWYEVRALPWPRLPQAVHLKQGATR